METFNFLKFRSPFLTLYLFLLVRLFTFVSFLLFHALIDFRVPYPPSLGQNSMKQFQTIVLSACFWNCWTLLVSRACTDDSQDDKHSHILRDRTCLCFSFGIYKKNKIVLKGAVTRHILPILPIWSFRSMEQQIWRDLLSKGPGTNGRTFCPSK